MCRQNFARIFQNGAAPSVEDVPKIKAALLLHFAEQDPNINGRWPEYEAALEAHRVRYEAYVYPKTNHGFHNDTPPRYDEAAAKLAWQRTIDHFNKNLKSWNPFIPKARPPKSRLQGNTFPLGEFPAGISSSLTFNAVRALADGL